MKFQKSDERTFKISQTAYDSLIEFIGNYPAERGAMLGRDKDGVIRHVAWDIAADCNCVEYNPSVELLNKVIKLWKEQGIEFCGFVHSHPHNYRQPSSADVHYSAEILGCFKKLDVLWIPIIQTIPTSGKFELLPFMAVPSKDRKTCKVFKTNLAIDNAQDPQSTIIKDLEQYLKQQKEECADNADVDISILYEQATKILQQWYDSDRFCTENLYGLLATHSTILPLGKCPIAMYDPTRRLSEVTQAKKQYEQHFQRQKEGHDLNLLMNTRLVIVGTGGAASFVLSAARMGFGEFILVDPDVVSESNIATQMVNPEDIGQHKVDVLAKKIIAINPLSVVKVFKQKIEDISDHNVECAIKMPIRTTLDEDNANLIVCPPKQTILLGLTDNFEAQAMVHRIGLQYGISTICAQVYEQGVAGEITYTVPDVTPACHRCITSSRYHAYLKDGYSNEVTSHGSPIFVADAINANLGLILLSVAYHNSNHPQYGDIIKKRGNRNLIYMKFLPFAKDVLGFDLVEHKLEQAGVQDKETFGMMLSAVSLPQTADKGQSKERPVCPDCGGLEDLTKCIGSFDDIKTIRH